MFILIKTNNLQISAEVDDIHLPKALEIMGLVSNAKRRFLVGWSGENKIYAIKTLRSLTKLDLKTANDIVEGLPGKPWEYVGKFPTVEELEKLKCSSFSWDILKWEMR
jgi:hypothetical protein